MFPEGCNTLPVDIPLIEINDESVEIPAEAMINEQIVESETEKEEAGTTVKTAADVTSAEDNEDETISTELAETTPFDVITVENETFVDSCCEQNRARIILSEPNSCSNLSTLVIPINLNDLEKVSISEIANLSNELDPVKLVLKLLRVIEKCRS